MSLLDKIEKARSKNIRKLLNDIGPLDTNNSIQELFIYSIKRQTVISYSDQGNNELINITMNFINKKMPQFLNQYADINQRITNESVSGDMTSRFGAISLLIMNFDRHPLLIKQINIDSSLVTEDEPIFLIGVGFTRKDGILFSYPQAIEEMDQCASKIKDLAK
jgi:hypothetical protein